MERHKIELHQIKRIFCKKKTESDPDGTKKKSGSFTARLTKHTIFCHVYTQICCKLGDSALMNTANLFIKYY